MLLLHWPDTSSGAVNLLAFASSSFRFDALPITGITWYETVSPGLTP